MRNCLNWLTLTPVLCSPGDGDRDCRWNCYCGNRMQLSWRWVLGKNKAGCWV